ncbi:hypothetical protein [Heyndrickxia camelliae]|uniref:hypothetical protein n=1 Tax=Heyndrickxia camelliae TaxID=1707093 RepID=UPI001A9C89F2|nr:hypothetical protein [Heyndrickxia camelliae]
MKSHCSVSKLAEGAPNKVVIPKSIGADKISGNCLGLKKNHLVDEVVELRDIMPTLWSAANIEIPQSVNGKSVLPLCPESSNVDWRKYIHGEPLPRE